MEAKMYSMCAINKYLTSVIVPAYNQENYILDTLDSIYAQTYQEIELLVADDHSMDRTFETIENWVEKHKGRFVCCEIFENPVNLGVTKNLNLLLKAIHGTYIKTLAGDDMLTADAIEKEVSFLENNPNVDLVYANGFYIGENEHYPILNINNYRLLYRKVPHYKNGILRAMLKYNVIAAPTVMLRNTTIEKFGTYREDLSFEDWEYFLRLVTGGARIAYLDYPVVAYRVLKSSASHFGNSDKEEKRWNKVLDSEEQILADYAPKIKDMSLDKFWNVRLCFCIDHSFDNTMNNILKNKKFKISVFSKLMLFTYKFSKYPILSLIYKALKKPLKKIIMR